MSARSVLEAAGSATAASARTVGPPPPPAPLCAGSRSGSALRLASLLLRTSAGDRSAAALPIAAFAVVTALLLTVAGGALMFFRWTTEVAGIYQVLSVLALALLVVPLVSLGGAAARLSARRRDDRLSSLRLLGATSGLVRRLAVLESVLYAAVGALVGTVGYVALMPLVGLVPFGGAQIGFAALWVGVPVLLGVLVGVCAIAAASAVIGLRGVVVDPLGVRAKQAAPRMHWLRLVVAVAVFAAASVVLGAIGGLGTALVATFLGGAVAASVAVLNLVGPWALAVAGRVKAKRAKTVEALVAARLILESPRMIWRQIGGVAMTTFVAIVAGSGVAIMGTFSADEADELSIQLVDDIRTGIVLTLVISFVMVACSVGINQAAGALDRRDLSVALDRMGVPRATLEKARRQSVMSPLLVVTVGSAIAGAVVILPLAGAAAIVAPLSLAVILGSIALGVGIVALALIATRPVVTAVLAAPERV